MCGLGRKSPSTGPGSALCRALLDTALLPKVQDHLHRSADLCSQAHQLISQLFHLLGLFPPHSHRVPAFTRKESRSCERAAAQLFPEPPSSGGAETEVLKPPSFFFAGLQMLRFPSRLSKRPRQERKARALGAVQASAGSTGSSAITPRNVLRVRRGEGSYRRESRSAAGCPSST